MSHKKLIQALGFSAKENSLGIFQKKYASADNYTIEIDFEKENFLFGDKIKAESKTSQNFSQAENWVVLECVDRLLEKGYQPGNITLEKTWATGHGTSGRLDVLVTRDNGSAYLMIECKTWGAEFDKEFKNLEKNGGQLFTYFQQDKDADVIMLYASDLDGNEVKYRNEIIKIEEDYRQTGNVKDFFERWNKLPKSNGVFDNWCTPYNFKSKALTPKDLQDITPKDSSKIFNQFLEILRHNVVSDKGNAFNKIFTLFLCKIYDEKFTADGDELKFQWREGIDDHVDFQKRLTDLYKLGMDEFLDKEVTDLSDEDFEKKYGFLISDDNAKAKLLTEFTRIRLEKNNEFAIKEVFDTPSFEENAKVVKEVVELLQGYKIRYTKKQQYLSDFFELLLTTGLKQESGQFFTPVPIAQFIIKSIPFDILVKEKLEKGKKNDLLPSVIDYASGSGHFVTESMHEIQKIITKTDASKYISNTKDKINAWKTNHFDWVFDYVYGIEKDYRLVKVGKVGCYLHGDGLAKVIHSDGLANFTKNKEYKGKLTSSNADFPQDNNAFDVVISNPPYSVSSFKNNARKYYSESDFSLYSRLTDQSSEIECLFIERTKQLLKPGGVAGVILPSSILSNTGIYTKARELILQYFDIVGIAEFGSNTFMATGTNTVTLFLRRRDNYFIQSLKTKVSNAFSEIRDVTINGIEKPIEKYVAHVWEGLSFDDYKTLLQKAPNEKIEVSEIYQEYKKKVKAKNEAELWNAIFALEQDKLLHFIIAYNQKLVLIKTGEKNEEKRFLGYEFSNRRGSEGIHPIQRSKSIEECTQLYDADTFENPEKASTYIYKAFNNEFDLDLPESLQKNVSYQNLLDMLTFDRVDFEKNISLSAKKKVKIESKWDQVRLDNITTLIKRGKSPSYGISDTQIIKSGQARGYYKFDFSKKYYVSEDYILDERKLEKGDLLLNSSGVGTAGRVTGFFLDGDFVVDSHISILRFDITKVLPKYVLNVFGVIGFKALQSLALGQSGQVEISFETISSFKIPLPPKDIQEKIVADIEILEEQEQKALGGVKSLKTKIKEIINRLNSYNKTTLDNISDNLDNLRKPVTKRDRENGLYPYYGASGIVDYVSDYLLDDTVLLISEDGANLKSRTYPVAFTATGRIWVNNHAHILKFKDEATHKLVELYINQTDISEFITGQAQPKLNQKNLNSIKIPLPILEKQQRIVAEIENIESKIAELESQIASIPSQKEAILKKYLD